MKLMLYLFIFSAAQICATPQEIADEIVAIYQEATDDYIGEAVSQLEHALQAGQQALYAYDPENGIDDETVIAAFLHDIGHRYRGADAQSMAGLGIVRHEALGAEFLAAWGFSPKVVALVAGHVDAKRYLVFKDPTYHDHLSQASQGTLLFQGGAMTSAEAAAFEQNPYFEQILLIRSFEERAKTAKALTPPLSFFKTLILRHLEA
jgi:2-amino-1-hydroxyethylphosphonate dioxygenase (glycine-forming)